MPLTPSATLVPSTTLTPGASLTPGGVTVVPPEETLPVSVYARRADGSVAGEMVEWDELTIVDRWRDVGRWTLVTQSEAIIAFFGATDVGIIFKRGEFVIMSGVPDFISKEYRGGAVTATISGPCDGWVLNNLAWGDPDAALSAQATAHDKRTGSPETLALGYIQDNLVTRLGMTYTIPASTGLGSTVTYRARFAPLIDVCRSVFAKEASVGFRMVQQSDDTIGVDVWQASDLTSQGALFSDQVGTVVDWTYTQEWPTATRAIVAGGDEGTARLFSATVDTVAESAWDRVAETFVDQRQVDPADATALDELELAGDETLTDTAGAKSFRLTITESVGLVYGANVRVGDLVRAYPGGVQVDDRITEAEIRVDRAGGEQMTLWVGQKADDPDERIERRAVRFDRRIRQLERAY